MKRKRVADSLKFVDEKLHRGPKHREGKKAGWRMEGGRKNPNVNVHLLFPVRIIDFPFAFHKGTAVAGGTRKRTGNLGHAVTIDHGQSVQLPSKISG